MKTACLKSLAVLALLGSLALSGCDGPRPARPPLTPADIDDRPFECSVDQGCIKP